MPSDHPDNYRHIPVMPGETIEALRVKPDGIYVDGTSGGGGHGGRIAQKLTDGGRLISLDRDEEAIKASAAHFAELGVTGRVTLVHENFVNTKAVLRDLNIQSVDGILLDLGVSSPQIDHADRGFSYMQDAPLDMRMDRGEGVSAREIVNTYEEAELTRILREYGEERFAPQIAKRIVAVRAEKEIVTTFDLNEIIDSAIPKKARAKGSHPAKRTYQALRIACNNELDILAPALSDMAEMLNGKGRLAVITFHSLEDRIVKIEFRRMENPCVCPADFPVCVCGKQSTGRVVTRKAITPSREEQGENPRAKSARLRVFEKGVTS